MRVRHGCGAGKACSILLENESANRSCDHVCYEARLVRNGLPSLMPQARRLKSAGITRHRLSGAASAWVERTLEKLSLRDKIGQLLMVPFFGGFEPVGSEAYGAALRHVQENGVGGLILDTARSPLGIRRSEVYATAVMVNDLQRRSKIPLLIGADFEFGTRMRLEEGTPIPAPMAIAATGDPALAFEAGRITALESRAAGVHWVFAPVADVNSNPDNPIINFRSFSGDARDAARYVAEYVRGVEANGALATAKHFPGHGNAAIDSHLSLPEIPASLADLEGNELLPFRAAIAAGVSSIMPGHLSVPALEPDTNIPATLSCRILTGLLREKMKFDGLIVTDAMEMGAITTLFPPGEAAVRAVEAGADVVLMPPVPDAALASIEQAVVTGRITLARIDTSVRRILKAKARLRLNEQRLIDVERLKDRFGKSEFEEKAQEIADRGVTLLRDGQNLLPLDSTRPLRVLLVALAGDRDPCPAETLAPEIQPRVDSLSVLRADTQFKTVATLTLPPPATYDVAIAALFVRVADRKGHVGFPEDQRAFVNQLIATGKPTALVAFGSPYLIERFPNARTCMGVFSTNSVAQRAAARALFGQTGIAGRIPVEVPGAIDRSAGLNRPSNPMVLRPATRAICERLKPAYEVLERGVRDQAFPGGVLAIGWKNELAIHPFGALAYGPKSAPVKPETVFDVASLTKVIVTTTAAMMLWETKHIDLDSRVARYLPEFARTAKADESECWRERITVRMLLQHSAGLAAHREFFKRAKGRRAVMDCVMAEPLVREPGTQIEYSDLGFILLGSMIEALTGQPLDAFAQKRIFEPLGMAHSCFNPPRNLRGRIAPTEKDSAFRKRQVHGEVHDENAWAMGGVAGHAGLFSTAGDVAGFAQMMLNGGMYAHHRLVTRATIEEFTMRRTLGDSAHALGWDVPVAPSSSGRYFSIRSYGHTGFTGTTLWIDPERELFVVLLTNRVHPTRANDKIRQVRPAVHDAIIESLDIVGTRFARQ